jgi:LysM repeat protein
MKIAKILAIATIAILLQVMVVSTSFAATSEYGYGSCGSDGGGMYHTVHYGETLFSIGRCYDVYPYAIADANGLWNPDYIYAGQVLYIPDGPAYRRGGWQNTGCGYDNNCGWQDNTGCGYDDCGWQDTGCNDNCGWQDTGCGYDNCGWQDNSGCNDNCGWQDTGCGYDDCGWQDNTGCNDDCGYNYGYGYDRSGYYYDAYYPGTNYGRYSYPCGYEYNCY